MNRSKTGVLLINLGTPDNCDPKSVFAYLKQFLNDPRVIDLPTVVRYVLVNWIIIPFRYKQSAHAYQQIWRDAGSPLLTNSQDLVNAVRQAFDSSIQIELGMRYGNPSIESAFNRLKDCQKIIAIPLFPQYSSAATGSATEELLRVLGEQWNIPEISVIRDFFNNPNFIAAYASIIKEHLNAKKSMPLFLAFMDYQNDILIKVHVILYVLDQNLALSPINSTPIVIGRNAMKPLVLLRRSYI